MNDIKIQGIEYRRQQTTARVNFLLKSQQTAFLTEIEAFVLPYIISAQPSREIDVSNWQIPHKIHFYRPDRVELLLAVEFYYQLLSIEQIGIGDNLPILQNISLGLLQKELVEPLAATKSRAKSKLKRIFY